ncbi:MAG: hypothetical protein P8M11_02995 [Planctomycetota bacterium]|nr:hypothetical protein [Planctomycetota bacterium]MDG1983509.1 hypothetical protein [Planctomycetota bacterium]
MKPRQRVGQAKTPDGTELELFEHDGHHEIVAGKRALMASRQHNSEEELAQHVCEGLEPGALVLIGGLGLGFTLRTALDLLPERGRAIQVELLDAVVEWNLGPAGAHAGDPLKDSRVKLIRGDVAKVLQRYGGALSALMLDIDNGPAPMVDRQNRALYGPAGIRLVRDSLQPDGRVAFWCSEEEPEFAAALGRGGFEVTKHRSYARPRRKGTRHQIIVGRKR